MHSPPHFRRRKSLVEAAYARKACNPMSHGSFGELVRDPEVGEPHATAIIEEDVGWANIAMNDVVLVEVIEAGRGLLKKMYSRFELGTTSVIAIGEGLAAVLHDKERSKLIVECDLVTPADVLMAERKSSAKLVRDGVAGLVRRGELRNEWREPRNPLVEHLICAPKAPPSQDLHDNVALAKCMAEWGLWELDSAFRQDRRGLRLRPRDPGRPPLRAAGAGRDGRSGNRWRRDLGKKTVEKLQPHVPDLRVSMIPVEKPAKSPGRGLQYPGKNLAESFVTANAGYRFDSCWRLEPSDCFEVPPLLPRLELARQIGAVGGMRAFETALHFLPDLLPRTPTLAPKHLLDEVVPVVAGPRSPIATEQLAKVSARVESDSVDERGLVAPAREIAPGRDSPQLSTAQEFE